MANVFRQALELLVKKDNGTQLTEEEQEVVNVALIPLLLLPEFNDIPIGEGLEELARIVEEAQVESPA